MMIMGNLKKMYVGAIENENDAASLYDRIAILVHGLKVRIMSHLLKSRLKQTLTTINSRFLNF